jgi:hypothetical protein
MANNWNCDGAGPHSTDPEVRRYPLGGGANLILCSACTARENRYRVIRANDKQNPIDPAAFPVHAWSTLKTYE